MNSASQTISELDGSQLNSMSKIWQFVYGINYTNIASGSSQSGTARIDGGTSFICDAINFGAYYNAANNVNTGNVRGQKISRIADVGDLAFFNSAHLGQIEIEISTQQRPWQDIPLRADLFTGEPGNLFFLPTPILVAPQDVITASCRNNLDTTRFTAGNAAIDAQLLFVGRKVTVQQPRR